MSEVDAIRVLLGALEQARQVLPGATRDASHALHSVNGAFDEALQCLTSAVLGLRNRGAGVTDIDPVWCDIESWMTEALFESERLREV